MKRDREEDNKTEIPKDKIDTYLLELCSRRDQRGHSDVKIVEKLETVSVHKVSRERYRVDSRPSATIE